MSISPCGASCGECRMLDGCGGCGGNAGKPFFLKELSVEVCPLYDCPVNKKGYKTCAECEKLPCEEFYSWRDPDVTEEEHREMVAREIEMLKSLNT